MQLTRAVVEQLYRDHGGMVMRRACLLLGSQARAEEALQEIFVKLLQKPAAFRGNACITTWLYRITTNHCLNALRRERTHAAWLSKQAEAPHLDNGADVWILLRHVLRYVDADAAQVAICVYVDQMTYDETADTLGLSRRTVCNKLQRFTRQARELLQDTPLLLAHAESPT